MKLYYEEVPNSWNCFSMKLQEHMDQVWKDNYYAFYKYLLIFDHMFGLDFLKEIQVHYDMNSKSKMFMDK
jgi:hypothetical protein